MKENKYEEAAKLFAEIMEEHPNDPVGYINFGNLLLHMDDLERAQRFFEKAISIDDTAATGYYSLGNLYYEQEKYKRAQESFQKAIDLGMENGDVYYMVGMALLNQEHVLLSIPYLLRATELKPTDEAKLFQYGLALAKSNYLSEAKNTFQRILSINSEHSDAHYNLGVIALFNEKTKKALQHFETALHIQPKHILAANGKSKVEKLLNENKR